MNEYKFLHQYPLNGKLKVGAYARISKDGTDLENSLETQIEYYTTLISSNPLWEYAGIYADAISGATIKKRNQFQLMITKAIAGEIDVILVKSISRFARNTIDLLSTIQELRDEGIEVFFEKERISTFDTKSDNYLTLYAQFAQEELVSISNNVKWTNKRNMESGSYFFDAARLFGYRFDDDRKVVINEKEAQYVRVIFEMYSQGENTASIADFLETNNVPTLTGKGRWSSSTLRRMLKNEKYCGDILIQKTYSENPITQKRIYNNGEREKYFLPNAIPAIVSRELWEKCQQIMGENAKKYKLGHKNCANKTTAFTGFGYCPYCRNTYFRKFNRKIEMLYCSSNKSRRQCTDSESVYISDLKKMIPILIKKLKDNKTNLRNDLINAFSSPSLCEQNNDEKTECESIKDIDLKISDLRNQLDKYANYNDDAFLSLKTELKKAIKELDNKKLILENGRLINLNPEIRAKQILNELEQLPTCDDIGDYNFRTLFKDLIVINRDRLIFVIGSDDLSTLPLNPNKIPMKYICEYKYKMRSTRSTCYFGIYINK